MRAAFCLCLVACSSPPHNNKPAQPSFSLSVDAAKLQRGAALLLELDVRLANQTEPTPLPVAYTHYSMETAAHLVYPASADSAGLTPKCDVVSVAEGGEFSCRLAFEFQYAAGSLTANAPIPSPTSPPCGTAGQHCESAADCCTGICDSAVKLCSLYTGACAPSGAACRNGGDCCLGSCYGGICAAFACLPTGAPCSQTALCCNGSSCEYPPHLCGDYSQSCKVLGDDCSATSDCCSGSCVGGRCTHDVSQCSVVGDLCLGTIGCRPLSG